MKLNYQFFNRTKTVPPFLTKLNERLSRSWGSLGSIGMNVTENSDGYDIMFFPAVREIHGGAMDGEKFFPGFSLNIGKFVRVFDRNPAPKVVFDCLQNGVIDHLVFSGKIDGHNVKVAVLAGAPPTQSPVERVYTQGPKKGMIEPILEA
jgi:hypothetical protein